MTEKRRDKVSEIASIIFRLLDCGNIIRDDEGHILAGLRYGSSNNTDSWSYLYYNLKGHMVSRPICYCDCKDAAPCKLFYVEREGKKPEILK